MSKQAILKWIIFALFYRINGNESDTGFSCQYFLCILINFFTLFLTFSFWLGFLMFLSKRKHCSPKFLLTCYQKILHTITISWMLNLAQNVYYWVLMFQVIIEVTVMKCSVKHCSFSNRYSCACRNFDFWHILYENKERIKGTELSFVARLLCSCYKLI